MRDDCKGSDVNSPGRKQVAVKSVRILAQKGKLSVEQKIVDCAWGVKVTTQKLSPERRSSLFINSRLDTISPQPFSRNSKIGENLARGEFDEKTEVQRHKL